jgi:serine phosphatase RsbU (regulator of sigma subunit)
MSYMKANIPRCVLFFCLALNILGLFSQTDEDILNKKADFILLAASKIYLPSSDTSKVFRIGIYGRENDVNDLYKELVSRSPELIVHNKPVEVYLFRRTRSIVPVDIFYVNGRSKIRISDIDIRLQDCSYFILTENFPYGTSMLNFAINSNKNLHFELKPDIIWSKGGKIDNKFLNAPNRVLSEKNWERILHAKNKQLEAEILKSEKQIDIIQEQTEEIIVQEEKIDYQRLIIYITIAFLFVVSVLAYFLAKEIKNKRRVLKLLVIKNKEITDSINYAKLIQEALLPAENTIFKSFSEGFIYYLPKDIVSGDYYWHYQYADISVLAVVDSSGHGVPGAFLSIMANKLFAFILNDSNVLKPGMVLQKMDDDFKETFSDDKNNMSEGLDIVIIAYDKLKNKLYYSGANRPLLMVRDKKLSVFESSRKSVGGIVTSKDTRYQTSHVDTQKGDCFYLFTDGYQDQLGGESGKRFSRKKIYSLLGKYSTLSMDYQKQEIHSTFINWKGNEEQTDDICMLGLKI